MERASFVCVRAFIDIMHFPASYPNPDLCPDLNLNPSLTPTLKPRPLNPETCDEAMIT